MITQYVSSSTPPSYISEYISAHIGAFDKYVGFYTGENSFDVVVSPAFGDSYVIHFFRSGSYSSPWTVSQSSADYEYSYSNALFVYDNEGIGRPITNNHSDLMFIGALVLVITLLYILKGGLFRWIENRRL